MFRIIFSWLPEEHKATLRSQLVTLTGMQAASQPKGASLEDYEFYRGFHWRLVSIEFANLMKPFWKNSVISDAFNALLDLFVEIHLFNYVHWDRKDPRFTAVRARYTLVIFQFSEKLRRVFSPDKIGAMNNIYTHKVLLHSLWVFQRYNLAACSCEQGEGLISIINSMLPLTSGSLEARLRKLLLNLTFNEEKLMSRPPSNTKSVVFDNFFFNYQPPTLRLDLSNEDYTILRTLFIETCHLPEPSTLFQVKQQRRSNTHRILCPPEDLVHMFRVSTCHSDNLSGPRRGPWILRVLRDPLPKDLFVPVPQRPNTTPSRHELLHTLQASMDQQIDLLSRGVKNCAEHAISLLQNLRNVPMSSRLKAIQQDPSLAAELGFPLAPEPKKTWRKAYLWNANAKDSTISKKSKAREAFEKEVLEIDFIADTQPTACYGFL